MPLKTTAVNTQTVSTLLVATIVPVSKDTLNFTVELFAVRMKIYFCSMFSKRRGNKMSQVKCVLYRSLNVKIESAGQAPFLTKALTAWWLRSLGVKNKNKLMIECCSISCCLCLLTKRFIINDDIITCYNDVIVNNKLL